MLPFRTMAFRKPPAAAGGSGDSLWTSRTSLLPLNGNKTDLKGAVWNNVGTPTFTSSNPPFAGLSSLEHLGSANSVSSPNSLGQLGSGQFGVEILFRCTSTANAYRSLAGNYDADSAANWYLALNASGQIYAYMDTGGIELIGSTDLRDSNWYLAQFVRDASNRVSLRVGRVGVDSSTTERAFTTGYTTNLNSTKPIQIGFEGTYHASPWYGQLAQFRVTVGAVPSSAMPTAAWPTSA